MKISEAIKYVGVNDLKIDLFEGQFDVPDGMAYNSYVIIDEKVCVMDSVDSSFGDVWLSNIEKALGGRSADYLVVQHMEMDHSSNILRFSQKYPEAKIVSSKMAFTMMKNMFGTDFAEKQIVVQEGSELNLGEHCLSFVGAANVHWPEVIVSFEKKEGVLFSADAFGKFGANGEIESDWVCEARRYYFGIVGKFGANVQTLLKKASNLEIKTICPLHGPVLFENIAYYLSLYDIWSRYEPETNGIAIAYTSVYGHTKEAAEKLYSLLKEKGCQSVSIFDIARSDMYECIEDAFRYSTLVLATTTYNGGIFPIMRDFVERLSERNFQKRRVAFIENGSWAPMAAKALESAFSQCKDIDIVGKISIKIALSAENEKSLEELSDTLLKE